MAHSPILQLPLELLETILSKLGLSDLHSCRLVNHAFDALIEDSAPICYQVECLLAGVARADDSSVPISEATQALRRKTDAWKTLSSEFVEQIDIPDATNFSGIYDLTAGTYVLGSCLQSHQKRVTTEVNVLRLPDRDSHGAPKEDQPAWYTIAHGPGTTPIIDIGLSVKEHDLMACVRRSSLSEADCDIWLYRLSDGEAHPLALNVLITVPKPSVTAVALPNENYGLHFLQAAIDKLHTGREDLVHPIINVIGGAGGVPIGIHPVTGVVFYPGGVTVGPSPILAGFDIPQTAGAPVVHVGPPFRYNFAIPSHAMNSIGNPEVMSTWQGLEEGEGKRAVSVEIVGDLMVVLLCFDRGTKPRNDRLLVYNWKTGQPAMCQEWPQNTYGSLCFLRADVICMPNNDEQCLDIYRVSLDDLESREKGFNTSLEDLPSPSLLHRLWLPQVRSGLEVRMSCRCEPNPLGPNSSYTDKSASNPFHTDPAEAIAVFNMFVGRATSFSFIVHRKSLLSFLSAPEESTEWDEWGPANTRFFSTEPIQANLITVADGQRYAFILLEDDKRIRVLDFNQLNVRRFVADHAAAGSGEENPPTSDEDIFEDTVEEQADEDEEWEDIVDSDDDGTEGLRVMQEDEEEGPLKRMGIELDPLPHDELSARVRVMTTPTTIDKPTESFKEPVVSRLPFMFSETEEHYRYSTVLMDDERIIGMKTPEPVAPGLRSTTKYDVLYLG